MSTPCRLAVRHLRLTAFRNYPVLTLDLPPLTAAFAVVLSGENGAGKTNLLEAVSLLVPGRGLRQARLGDLRCLNPGRDMVADGGWGVAAEVDGRLGPVLLGTGQESGTASVATNRREVRIERQPVSSQTALADHLAMAWLTPAMDGLFREGAAERRKFLDRLVFSFDPGHAGRITRYEKLLRERARLLREAAETGRTADAGWLDSLEAGMAETGTAIAAERLVLVERLNRVASADLAPFPAADLTLDGQPEAWLAEGMAAGAAEDRLRAILAASRATDAASGTTANGPQRSDLLAHHRQHAMPAGLCSTGEQKALLLSIVLAHARLVRAETGAAPILLLDEVAAHLDQRRREALFERLAAQDSQVWMTGTDQDVFAPLGAAASFLAIAHGTLQKAV